MSLVLTIARAAAGVNALLLIGLLYVWAQNYRQFRAQHTLGLVTFGVLLFLQNALAFYLYNFHPVFNGWLDAAAPIAQNGMMALTVLELLALVFLSRITWL